MMIMTIAALAAWGAVGWRLRGGAFTALTGVDPGTDGARFLFGSLWMAAPCLALDWRAALLIPALFAALLTEGWGGYMALGHETAPPALRLPYDTILRLLGLSRPGWRRDAAGLLLCGLWLLTLPAAAVWRLDGPWRAAAALAIGAWMPAAYWLAYQLRPPLLGKFVDDTTVWGEVFFGAILCPGLFLALGGLHG